MLQDDKHSRTVVQWVVCAEPHYDIGHVMDKCCNVIAQALHLNCGLGMSPIASIQFGGLYRQLWQLEPLSFSHGESFGACLAKQYYYRALVTYYNDVRGKMWV